MPRSLLVAVVVLVTSSVVCARYYDYIAMREGGGDAREMAREQNQMLSMFNMFGFGDMFGGLTGRGGGDFFGMSTGRRSTRRGQRTKSSYFDFGNSFNPFGRQWGGGFWGGEAMYDA